VGLSCDSAKGTVASSCEYDNEIMAFIYSYTPKRAEFGLIKTHLVSQRGLCCMALTGPASVIL
jgi:hypothetical protein